ncbi:MAG: hypothetical protein ACE5EU_14245 [Paracoccaceae bacterium]
MRRVHDMGGRAAGPIDTSEHPDKRWHMEFFVLLRTLISPKRRIMRLDEMRRAVEDLGEEKYDAMAYYDRQTVATAQILIEKGILTREEIDRRIGELRRRKREAD